MSGKRRTLWRGSVEVTEEEELDIAITTHLPSQRGQETFDWKVKNDEVGLVCLRNSGLKNIFQASLLRLPRSCLSRPNDLRTFLRESSIVEVVLFCKIYQTLLVIWIN